MSAVLLALAPIFALIVLGYGLRIFRILDDGFWRPAEHLTYMVLFPALLISSVAEANLSGMPLLELIKAHGTAILMLLGLTVAATPLLRSIDGRAFSSVFQGVQRPNTYVALAAAGSMYGQTGIALAAFCATIVVPMVNVYSAIGMVVWAHPGGDQSRTKLIAKAIATNPLVLSCVIGGLLNWSGIGLTPVLASTLKILGQASLSLGLLVVGAGIDLSTLHAHRRPLVLTCLGKLIALPALVGLIGRFLGVDTVPLEVAVLYAAVPTSASSYVMARQMNGDPGLMAAIITCTTLAAFVTMPLVLWVVRW